MATWKFLNSATGKYKKIALGTVELFSNRNLDLGEFIFIHKRYGFELKK